MAEVSIESSISNNLNSVQKDVDRIEKDYNNLKERIGTLENSKRTDMIAILGGVVAVATLAAGLIWFVINQNSEATIGPVKEQIKSMGFTLTDLTNRVNNHHSNHPDKELAIQIGHKKERIDRLFEIVDAMEANLAKTIIDIESVNSNTAKIGSLTDEVWRVEDKFKTLVTKLEESAKDLAALAEIIEALGRLEERHGALRKSFDENQGKFENIATLNAGQSSRIEQALLLVSKIEGRVSQVEDLATNNQRSMSNIAGTSEANFVEIESQLRGLNAYFNAQIDYIKWALQMIANNPDLKITDMPGYNSERIPAGATTTPGRVKQNGG